LLIPDPRSLIPVNNR